MRRGSIIAGVVLIAAGALLLVLPLFPNVSDFINIEKQWPLIIVGVGGFFILGALLGTPELAVPGAIVGGIGLMLYYQNLFDAWYIESSRNTERNLPGAPFNLRGAASLTY